VIEITALLHLFLVLTIGTIKRPIFLIDLVFITKVMLRINTGAYHASRKIKNLL